MMPILIYCIIALFIFYTFKNKKPLRWNEVVNALTFNTRQNDDTFRIPGPLRLPFFGTKWNSLFSKLNKLHEYYAELNVKYGDVVMEMMGGVPVISLFKRQDIEKVLKFPSEHPFRPPTEIVSIYRKSRPDRYSSVGLVNAQGPEWAHLRAKLANKNLDNRNFLALFCPNLNNICDDFIKIIKERRDEQNIVAGVDDHLKSMSFESSCCFILGKRMGFLTEISDDNNLRELASAVNNIFKSFRDAYYGNGLWKYFPQMSTMYRNFVENEEKAYDIVLEIVENTLKNEKTLADSENEAPSVLTSILKANLDHKEKISGVIDFLTAGIELLSHTISFILYYLTINPEAQERIYEETEHMSEELTMDDLCRAHYTRAAIFEASRLSPGAFAVARILETDFYLSGYHLKPGTIVLCQNMVASRKNENFDDATEYKPERWLDESGRFNMNQCVGSSITLPFGCGKRICPGKKYTELELMILVIKLVRSFKIKYHSEFDMQFEFILAAKAPVNIQFCDRN